MAMKMLEAGGVPVLTDHIRTADTSNPNGYYEYERVKELDKSQDTSWLANGRGKAVKIISMLLTWLPETYTYNVIFMERDLGETLASQDQMLTARGEAADATDHVRMVSHYEQHLANVRRFLQARPCFSTLRVDYNETLQEPNRTAQRVNEFLGGHLDVRQMAAVVDAQLYRNRH